MGQSESASQAAQTGQKVLPAVGLIVIGHRFEQIYRYSPLSVELGVGTEMAANMLRVSHLVLFIISLASNGHASPMQFKSKLAAMRKTDRNAKDIGGNLSTMNMKRKTLSHLDPQESRPFRQDPPDVLA